MGDLIARYNQALFAFEDAAKLFRSDTQRYKGVLSKAMTELAEAESALAKATAPQLRAVSQIPFNE